jgi:hypothetical protein
MKYKCLFCLGIESNRGLINLSQNDFAHNQGFRSKEIFKVILKKNWQKCCNQRTLLPIWKYYCNARHFSNHHRNCRGNVFNLWRYIRNCGELIPTNTGDIEGNSSSMRHSTNKFFNSSSCSLFHSRAVKRSLRSHIQSYDNVEKMKLARRRTSLIQPPFQNRRKAFTFTGKLTTRRFSESEASFCLSRTQIVAFVQNCKFEWCENLNNFL